MTVKERGYELAVHCRACGKEHILMVGVEDYLVFDMPNRPHIQDIFPYLTPAERELLISGICGECWKRMFPEPEDFEDFEEEDSENE